MNEVQGTMLVSGWTQIPPLDLTVAEAPKAVSYQEALEARPEPAPQWERLEYDFGGGNVVIVKIPIKQHPQAKTAPLHPLQRMSSQPNTFGQSMWRPWE